MKTWQDALKGATVDDTPKQTTCRVEPWKTDCLLADMKKAGLENVSENAAINAAINYYLEAHGHRKPAAPCADDAETVLTSLKLVDGQGYRDVLRRHLDALLATGARLIA